MIEPGGHLILRDSDLAIFTNENPPPLEGQELDIVAYSQGKSTLATINRIFLGWALRQGFVVGCVRTSISAFRAGAHLTTAFRIISGRCSKMRLFGSCHLRAHYPLAGNTVLPTSG